MQAEASYHVIATCRKESEGLTKLVADAGKDSVTVVEGVDVSSAAGIEALTKGTAAVLGDNKLDVVINNAGILETEGLGDLTGDARDAAFGNIERQMAVNAIAPLQVATALLPSVKKDGGKLGFITSRMGSIADNGSGGMYGYRMSKAALNAGCVSLARDLKDQGIAVAILHPGMVTTDMTARFGASGISTEDSASGLLARMSELTMENSGTFWHKSGEVLPW